MKRLTDEERATYEWQIWVPGFGEAGQEKLKNATALISRCGGLGGPLAYSLAAAGIGKLVIAHAGNVKHSDLNRQITNTYDWLGKPRAESAPRRLRELNPRLEVESVAENVSEENAAGLVEKVDIVFDCAPLFTERFAMNAECVRQRKPMVEAAMYSLEGQVTTIIPGETPCLACIYPETPPQWKREFPVFGAVSALAANVAVMEGIKLLSGMGPALAGKLLYYDTGDMSFQKVPIARRPDCPICGDL
jgi:molybdopterin-synthase adenylyltransferase